MPEEEEGVISANAAIVAEATARQRDRALNESAVWEAKCIELLQQIMVMKEVLTDEQREQLFPEPPSVMNEAETEPDKEDEDGIQ